MPLPTTPYPVNPFAQAMESGGDLLSTIMQIKKAHDMKQMLDQPLGSVLGYDKAPDTVPAPGPYAPGQAPMLPNPAAGTYPTAPPAMQHVMTAPVSNLYHLRSVLGDSGVGNLMYGMGFGRGAGDFGSLIWDPTSQQFSMRPGAPVSPRTAGVIMRQKEANAKEEQQAMMNYYRKQALRLADQKGTTDQEALSLKADADILNAMVSPQYDLLGDTIKAQFDAQAKAAIQRMQQRGVKVYTGTRANAQPTPSAGSPAAPPPPAKKAPEVRYAEIAAQNPNLSPQQIYAQMAVEEASGQ